MKCLCIYTLLLVLNFKAGFAQAPPQRSTVFGVKSPGSIFLGGILNSEDINTDTHLMLKIPVKEVQVSYSLPVRSHSLNPSYEGMISAIREHVSAKLNANYKFSYTLLKADSYSDLSNIMGQHVYVQRLLGLKEERKSMATLLIADLKSVFFSMDMDLPQQDYADVKALKAYDKNKLLVVNSLKFGRRVLVALESDLPYSEVEQAFKAFMDGKPDLKSKAVMANCTSRVLCFGASLPEADPDNFLSGIVSYLNGKVHAMDFGVPIEFSASYLKDNASFENKF